MRSLWLNTIEMIDADDDVANAVTADIDVANAPAVSACTYRYRDGDKRRTYAGADAQAARGRAGLLNAVLLLGHESAFNFVPHLLPEPLELKNRM